MRLAAHRIFQSTIRMASSSSAFTSASTSTPPSSSKLIFAPSSQKDSHRADQYTLSTLSLRSLSPNPFTQFHTWFTATQHHPIPQPESVCLSTASLPSGRISSRFVYLKELDSRGFVIYSNWATSRKAADVRTNPYASLAWWWREMERQVRVEGRVERLSREESQAYFRLRERGSQVGAWASEQSSVLAPSASKEGEEERKGKNEDGREEEQDEDDGRAVLERRVKDVEERFKDVEDIPVPDFWGGLRVVPDVVEFWQGRPSRLHDRFRYSRDESVEGGWRIERLSP